jgi:hypothetical protein
MKHIIKFLKRLLIIVSALLILLVLIAELAEDAIVNRTLKVINQTVPATVEIGDVSFSLIKKFPLATLEFKNIIVKSNQDSVELSLRPDTLLNAARLFVSVNAMDLMNGSLVVKRLDLEKGNCNYFVNDQGLGNFDFLFPESDTITDKSNSTSYSINLKKIVLKELKLNYWDVQNTTRASLLFEKNKAKIKLNKDVCVAQITGNASCSNCSFSDSPLNMMQKAEVSYQLNYKNGVLGIKSIKLSSEGLELNANGNINLTQKFPANIQVQNCRIHLDTISKYIPKTLMSEYGIEKVAGTVNLKASIKGDLLDSILPHTKVDLNLIQGEILSQHYPVVDQINLKFSLTNGELRNLQSTTINCERLQFSSNKSNAKLDFTIKDLTQPLYTFNSDIHLNLAELNSLIPDTLVQKIKGEIQANINGKGKLTSWDQLQDPDYLRQNSKANIKITNLSCQKDSNLAIETVSAQLSYNQDSIRIEKLKGSLPAQHLNIRNTSLLAHLKGKMSNLSHFGLDIESVQLETNYCKLLGTISLNNLTKPNYKLSCQSSFDLAEIKKLIPDSLITDVSGQVDFNIVSTGQIHPDSISNEVADLFLNKSETLINFRDMSVLLPDPMMNIDQFSGQISLKRDTLRINQTMGVFNGMDFKVDSTQILNYYNTLIDNKAEQLSVVGSLHFGDIDYALVDSLMNNYQEKSANPKQEVEVKPRNFNFEVKGNLSCNSFKYKNAKFTNINSLFNASDSLYIFDQFEFNAFGGKVNNSIKYSIVSDNRQSLAVKNNTEQIDIHQLLKDFDNFKEFEQDYIVADQISGKLTTDLHGQFLLLGDTLVNDSTMVKGNLKLENGGLFNYEPAQELSKFTNITELDNMKFKTIESQVFVFKNAVYVPQTEIKSNAMDISAYGMQTFGEDYEYHLRIYLGEILYGKTKRIREKQEKKKNKPDGGTSGLKSLFVVSKSINGETKNGLDSKKARMRMKTKIKLQNVVLDIIFHPKLENFETGVNRTYTKK